MRVQAHHWAAPHKTTPRGHGLARWLTGMPLLGRETGLWTFSFSRQVELGFYGSTSFLQTFWQSAIANLGVKPAHCRVCCFGRRIAPLPIQRSAKAVTHRSKPGGVHAFSATGFTPVVFRLLHYDGRIAGESMQMRVLPFSITEISVFFTGVLRGSPPSAEFSVVQRPDSTGVNPAAKVRSPPPGFTPVVFRPLHYPHLSQSSSSTSENITFAHDRAIPSLHSRKHDVCFSDPLRSCCILEGSKPRRRLVAGTTGPM